MATKEYPVVWLQGAGCTGCSISVLNAVSPRIQNLLLDEVVPGHHLNMLFNATIMAGEGEAVIEVLKDTETERKGGYILVVEGAIPTAADGLYGSIGERGGRHLTIEQSVAELGANALVAIAIGTCAAYGGIPAGKPNPTQCKGVKELFDEKGIDTLVVNLPGCPVHPDWFTGTVSVIMFSGLDAVKLDNVGRPELFYGRLIHENCPRRADFDKGRFAEKLGDQGCLYKLGCKGHYTNADCPIRQWNNGVSWCIKAGSPCLGCVEPEFPDGMSPIYEIVTFEDLK
ncbi:MAG TPA: hydrogenase small subunit [Planctomycetes bacterium]|nr:hydrogenase small subunit [Planctomycetota bacterium]HIJ69826.1 hydrogenase small subunit [Planctomycetota bacterium]